MNSKLVTNNINRGSYIPLFSFPAFFWCFVFCFGSMSTVRAQSTSENKPTAFRKTLDFDAMSPVFNQDNISRIEGEGEIAFMPLMGWKQHRIFRRTRLLTLPSRVWVPFKDTTLDGDSGIYKEKILRVRGRLVTATDSGAWIYQHGKKRVVYVPYTQTAIIKSGSSTGRTMYLAIMPVAAQIATWAALDAANADIYGSGHGLIGASVIFLTGCTDMMLWMDYMDKKSHSPLCSLHINGSRATGLYYKRYAEGGWAQSRAGVVEVLLSNRNSGIFPRTHLRRTSVNAALFPQGITPK